MDTFEKDKQDAVVFQGEEIKELKQDIEFLKIGTRNLGFWNQDDQWIRTKDLCWSKQFEEIFFWGTMLLLD